MATRILNILIFLLAWCFVQTGHTQETPKARWDAVKIKGTGFLPYPSYTGFPFLNSGWVQGKIEFTNGIFADSLNLRYSSFKDELIYFNKTISAQIIIDKASLNGFSFTDEKGNIRIFRKQYYDGYAGGDRYFEVLSAGEISLLAYRKVSLTTTSPYKNKNGVLINLVYEPDYQFYFYSAKHGYTSVRLTTNGLLAKFDKASRSQVKKLLRKNRIKISGEESFIKAWKVIEKEGLLVIF